MPSVHDIESRAFFCRLRCRDVAPPTRFLRARGGGRRRRGGIIIIIIPVPVEVGECCRFQGPFDTARSWTTCMDDAFHHMLCLTADASQLLASRIHNAKEDRVTRCQTVRCRTWKPQDILCHRPLAYLPAAATEIARGPAQPALPPSSPAGSSRARLGHRGI